MAASCFVRPVLRGTLPRACHAAGMRSFLNACGMPIFDYGVFARELRDRIRRKAERMAGEAEVSIQFIAKPGQIPHPDEPEPRRFTSL